jgi:hypothetical protein
MKGEKDANMIQKTFILEITDFRTIQKYARQKRMGMNPSALSHALHLIINQWIFVKGMTTETLTAKPPKHISNVLEDVNNEIKKGTPDE